MHRGAWQATVHGVARVGHDLVTKPPPPPTIFNQPSLSLTEISRKNNKYLRFDQYCYGGKTINTICWMREKPHCGRCLIPFITLISVVDPGNCSLLGLLNSGTPYGSKDVLPLCTALWTPHPPTKALWGEPLVSPGSSPHPQEWLFFTASCPVHTEWWFPLFCFYLVDSIKRINSTSLTLCWSEVGVLFWVQQLDTPGLQ